MSSFWFCTQRPLFDKQKWLSLVGGHCSSLGGLLHIGNHLITTATIAATRASTKTVATVADSNRFLAVAASKARGCFVHARLAGRRTNRLLALFGGVLGSQFVLGANATDTLGAVARKVHDTVQCHQLLASILVDESKFPYLLTERCRIRIRLTCSQRVHKGRLKQTHAAFAKTTPKGGTLQLGRRKLKESRYRLRDKPQLARGIKHDNQIGNGLENLLLATETVVFFLEFFNELLLALATQLGRAAIGGALYLLLFLQIVRSNAFLPTRIDSRRNGGRLDKRGRVGRHRNGIDHGWWRHAIGVVASGGTVVVFVVLDGLGSLGEVVGRCSCKVKREKGRELVSKSHQL